MRSAAALLGSMAGLIGWAGAFTLVYALHGIGCARGWHEVAVGATSLQRAALVGAWLACLLALAWLVRRAGRSPHRGRPEQRLLATLAQASAWSGLAATVFTLFSVLVASPCL